jgi:ATP-dependent exoDNAse (exonuclease V) beta subunit
MVETSNSPKKRPSDLEVLEEIQDKIIEELRSKEINPKVGDLLKALELNQKQRKQRRRTQTFRASPVMRAATRRISDGCG